MCYYDNYRFECGDWRWGTFQMHCEKEYRMGETCGLKLIYSTNPIRSVCRICQNIDVKRRKLRKTLMDYQRFQLDSQRQATASSRYQEVLDLSRTVKDLEEERFYRMNRVGNVRRRKTGTVLQQVAIQTNQALHG